MKRILTLLLALTMILVCIPFSAGAAKVDTSAAFIKGYEDGTFRPDNNMTRAEAVTALLRLLVDETTIKGKYACNFTDVAKTEWYYDYIAYFNTMGYLSSYKGTFSPNQNITRAEFVELIVAVGSFEKYMFKDFADVDSSNPRYYQISAAASTGLIAGYPDGTFGPDRDITRAEVVTIINRYLKRTPTGNAGNTVFSDIVGHWAAPQVYAAVSKSVENVGGVDVQVWTETPVKTDYTYEIDPLSTTIVDYINDLRRVQPTMSHVDEFINAVDTVSERAKQDIINSPDELDLSGTVYYVSSSTGNDSNDGKTPETAWATIGKANGAGGTVLFKRGDVFRGRLWPKANTTYGAYGEGEKPRLYGSADNFAGKSNWENTQYPNVYKCKTLFSDDVGIIYFNEEDVHPVPGVATYTVGKKEIKGYGGFPGENALNNDLNFYHNLATHELFVYSKDGNPGTRFKHIEIGTNANIVECCGNPNVHLDNLMIMFGGAHAIGASNITNLRVTNCTIGWIGGSLLDGIQTLYGNAIQIYGQCNGFYVEHNYCYQCYDTGITIQYTTTGTSIQRDVSFRENVVEYCHWNLEFYNSGAPANSEVVKLSENFDISYNISRFNGCGWGSRHRSGIAGSYQDNAQPGGGKTKNYKIEGNLFEGSLGSIYVINNDGSSVAEMDGNIIIQPNKKPIGSFKGVKAYANKDAYKVVSEQFGDKNAIVVVADAMQKIY